MEPKPNTKKILILDRDNTINRDTGYTYRLKDLVLIEESVELLASAAELRIPVVIISNQSLVNRGLASLDEVEKFNDALVEKLEKKKCKIDAIIFCPHIPEEECSCRKPKIDMFLEAFRYYPEASEFCYVGDSESDMEAAKNAGIEFFSSSIKYGYTQAINWLTK
jgi:histidinol-phosphate phosphatase family protein